jgi:hypothetical protein
MTCFLQINRKMADVLMAGAGGGGDDEGYGGRERRAPADKICAGLVR